MSALRIIASRHSAFYSPLIATLAAGFLDEEGLAATYRQLAPGERAQELIAAGEAHIVQSAVSMGWLALERGERDIPVHFAQINCRDGFFLVARERPARFEWKMLEGATVLADHASQPLAMLRYALHRQGVVWERVRALDRGEPDRMVGAFLDGEGDYVHLQGPAAQQLEHQGAGFVVAAVGEAMPPLAFSSLMASREFLATAEAAAFLRAYARARRWVRSSPAREVAACEASFFAGIAPEALEAAIARYQSLGCWEGGVGVAREHYEQALEVFLHTGSITRRWEYEAVVVALPEPAA
ncbi:MAG: ABC transporter substrate-binding protein [Bryobacterales bacterium]|nr:ABC transporter substrate-binding protein [Bryobacteraceae bacterium]MDW8129112.1 ABC transporter substrate-binding protein [Bryobacterales bacterium]